MTESSETTPTSLFCAVGVVGAFSGKFEGWWITVPLAFMLVLFVIACAVMHARARKTDRERSLLIEQRDQGVTDLRDAKKALTDLADLHTQELGAQAEEYDEHLKAYRESLLHYELHNLLVLVGAAVATNDRTERQSRARTARQSIVCATAKLVGESERNGTRANLFKFDTPQCKESSDTTATMRLEPGASAGRGSPSSRVFDAEHLTTRKTLQNRFQFVDVSTLEPEPDGEPLPYATYATHPISSKDDVLHGVLTVDSLTEGVLEERVDLPMLAVLTDLIAITYECEKYPKPLEPKKSSTSIATNPLVATDQRGFE